jgi:hypothetical protein
VAPVEFIEYAQVDANAAFRRVELHRDARHEDGVAGRARAAVVEAGTRAYEDAGVRGLCEEGRWEAAVDAMRSLDLKGVVEAEKGPPRERRH